MIDRPRDDEDDLPPPTRDLADLVTHLTQTEAELRHQVARLGNTIPRTPGEAEHLPRLREQYKEAAYAVRTLRRYHQGRLDRQQRGETHEPTTSTGIDARGVATAHFEDE